jgi:hypothetical protein
MPKQILLNRIKTPDGTILTSYHRHDYKRYLDKNGEYYEVDGGNCYFSRSINIIPYEEMYVLDDGTFETRRNFMHWGQNYDKNNKLLKETKWTPIKDLTSDHICSILRKVKRIKRIYIDTMLKELEYRESW